MGKIYRYISFGSFVNLILTKELTFVHPSLWDDPYEEEILARYIKEIASQKDSISSSIHYIMTQDIYCSSWTRNEESDALWRIYSYNNNSIRIEVDEVEISLLDDVIIKDIEYVNDISEYKKPTKNLYDYISVKRIAFSHEEEVRLFRKYKFKSVEDIKEKVRAFWLIFGIDTKWGKDIINEIKIEDISIEVNKAKESLGFENMISKVSFKHIDGFINSVMLNPFAEDWMDETLKIFCRRYKLNYLGKSELYRKND